MKRLGLLLVLLCAVWAWADTPIALDNFTRSNAPTLGTNYTVIQGTWGISNNSAVLQTAPGNSNPVIYTGGSSWSGIGGSNDQYTLIRANAWDTSARKGAAVRWQSGAKSGYTAYCTGVTSGNCTTIVLAKVTNDSYTTLQTITGLSIAPTVGWALRVSGSSLTVYTNGAQVGTVTTDTTYTSGSPGLTGFVNWTSTYGITYAEFGTPTLPQAVTPTISLATGSQFITQQSVTLTCSTTGSSIYYTTDGTTPTTGSTLYSGAFTTVSSGAETINALCTASGYSNSNVATSSFYINPPDQQFATDDFGSYFDADLNYGYPTNTAAMFYQLPIDAQWTNGYWTATNTSTGYMAFPEPDTVNGSGYGIAGQSGDGYIARTHEQYPNDQYSKAYVHTYSGSVENIIVGVRCASSGTSLTGYILYVQNTATPSIVLYKYVSGTPTILGSNYSATVSNGDSFELRVVGNTIQPLQNGSAIAGLSATYTDSALTSGSPCLGVRSATNSGASVYNWSGGAIAGSMPTITYNTYPGPTYSAYSLGGATSGWSSAYPWIIDGPSPQGGVSAGSVCCNYGGAGSGTYAVGTMGGLSQMHYQVPVQDNQWIHAKIALDSTAWNNRNWFLKLQSQAIVPPASMSPAASGCYDIQSIYIGDEPMNQRPEDCGTSVEYCGTNWLHVTIDTPDTSTPIPTNGISSACNYIQNYNVYTVAGSFYTPMHGDEVYAEFVSSNLHVYCKGGNTILRWSPGLSTTARVRQNTTGGVSGTIILDSNGNYQVAISSGTTGSVEPTWSTSKGTNATNGGTTVDGTVTWQYIGAQCPTSDKFTEVMDSYIPDLTGGFPGLWAATNAGSEYVFQDITLGSGSACGSTYTCVDSGVQPVMFVQW